MRRFEYRPPRYPADVSVSLVIEGLNMAGRCLEISLEGMRGRFEKSLATKALGTVSLAYRGLRVEVPIRVAHCTPNYEGLKFLFDSEEQKNSVERLIGLITDPPAPHGLALVR